MAKTTTKSKSSKSKTRKKVTRGAGAQTAVRTRSFRLGRYFSSEATGLRKLNAALAVLYIVQGVLILLLSRRVTLPLTTTYLTTDSLATEAAGYPVLVNAVRHLQDINVAILLAVGLFIFGVLHLVMATAYRAQYEQDLEQNINPIGRLGIAVAAAVLMVTVAMLSGVFDLSSLLMIFTLTALTSLVSLLTEVYRRTSGLAYRLSFIIGAKTGLVPWVVVLIYVWGARTYGDGGLSTYLYFIYASLLMILAATAVINNWHFQKKGKWADYRYMERASLALGFLAASALAWQVFAGTLR